ncbi:glycine betaine ABC transporter substrate-binding protein [Metabacillus halosaccharovorans]|uniref:Glycine/betaine ABC transporter n=1 Tax=Metabacillus halosaccharovorans TaxID=930124 RepID=A0ABT3DEJ6_9BACI|nr:glycine betaine ABC transporter substrate-binding protein [Metabacillus halosaccharovorans]MCV9885495.1 glycine/betaine ABC transporter [Metabacillus halosaccharovorans]
MFTKLTKATLALGLTFGLAACGGEETSNDSSNSEGSTASVGESVEYKITGIDPGAGIMKATSSALEEYELTDWELVEGSGAAMTAALQKAYKKEEPIIVTGWTPHWMFSKFDLKYLEDPKGVYGEAENIHSIARNGLAEDLPGVHKVLDQFFWTPDEMGVVMSAIQDGTAPEEAAAAWVEDNADKVAEWTEGAEKGNGEEVKLAYVAWDSEIASTNVVAKILTDLGYEVTLSQVEAGPMWAGVADGSVDAHIAGWLPLTHADQYEKYEGDFEDLGENLEGAKTGLVVPAYMDIDSIEDLKE